MSETRKRPSTMFLGIEYNNFLFASLGIDRVGGQLTVVSALARLDMDPWEEAKKLSKLSDEAAARKLMAFMARFPELATRYDEQSKAAKRLVALLPERSVGIAGAPGKVAAGGVAAGNGVLAGFCVLCLVLLVAGQIFWTMRPDAHSAPVHGATPIGGAAHAPSVPGS